MKSGDLLRARSTFEVGHVRIYIDDQCDHWEAHMKEHDIALFLEENPHHRSGHEVVKALLPQGIRWMYKVDLVKV